MKKIITLLALSVLLSYVLFSKEKNFFPGKKIYNSNQDTTYNIFSLQKGYGFNILIDKKILIHQPFIPSLQGNRGFATKTDAARTAKLMLYKLKKFGMPPTISTAELDSLHIHLNL
jgi:hypothetical protein